MSTDSRNSRLVDAIVLVLGLLAAWWAGWQGVVIYVMGFLAGGLGTAVNACRAWKR